jgi:hypothetical protein
MRVADEEEHNGSRGTPNSQPRDKSEMADPDTLKRGLTIVDSFSKFTAAAVGVLYLTGFLAVSAHLSRYGVSGFSILQLQYLVAGMWVLGPPFALVSVVYSARDFEERAAPDTTGKFNWRRLLISLFLTAIPYALFWGILASIPGVLLGIMSMTGIRLYLFYLAMLVCAQVLWISWQVQPAKETWLVNRQAVPFHITLLLSVTLTYVIWFAVRIYPLIPFSLGGGRPLTVAFIAGEKRLPAEIKPDSASNRSIPYKLLLATDRYYVVLSQNRDERSIEVSRDSVAGIVVLEENAAH